MSKRNADPVEHESTNPLQERLEQLKQLFPEAVNEDGIDLDTLVNLLGKEEKRKEREIEIREAQAKKQIRLEQAQADLEVAEAAELQLLTRGQHVFDHAEGRVDQLRALAAGEGDVAIRSTLSD